MGAASGNGFDLHGARVNVEGMRLSTDAMPGTEVSVRGRWDGTTLHAQAVAVAPSRQNVGRPERVVLEGYVHAVLGNEVSLGTRVVTLAPGVRISGMPGEALAVNQRVQITGRVDKDQRVTADRVNVRSGASDAKTNPRRDADDDRKSDDKGGDDSGSNSSGHGSDDGDSSGSNSGSSGSDDGSKSGSDDSGTSRSTSSTSGTSGSSDSSSSGSDSSGSSSSGSGGSTSGSSGSTSGSSDSSGKGSSGSGSGSSGSGSSGGGKSGGGKSDGGKK
jgi:hypothetical protein